MADSEVFAQVTDQSFWLTGRLIFEEASCVAVFLLEIRRVSHA
jgi:hypothetical protein